MTTSTWDGRITVANDVALNGGEGTSASLYLIPPTGQTFQAGKTYLADLGDVDFTPSTRAKFQLWRDGRMCGRTASQLFGEYESPVTATGWFRIGELEHDGDGRVTRFAATYEINCQYLDGSPGSEGSIAVSSTSPAAAVPAAPAAPAAVTDLAVTNVGPNGSGDNVTTLTWTNPAGASDVEVDVLYSTDRAKFPALVGSHDIDHHLVRTDSFREGQIGYMTTRTYRVVARGAHGRLGRPAYVAVLGTYLTFPRVSQTITIGHEAHVTGRLTQSWDYVDPADSNDGPPMVGRTVLLCRQTKADFNAGRCAAVDRTRTDARGRFTLTAEPDQNTYYSVKVPATTTMLGNNSRVLSTLVAPQTDLDAPEALDTPSGVGRATLTERTGVRRGAVIHFTTSRARAGSRGVVRLQRLDGKKWHTVARASLGKGSARSRVAVPYRESKRGVHSYRIVKVADAHHVDGHSHVVRIRVR